MAKKAISYFYGSFASYFLAIPIAYFIGGVSAVVVMSILAVLETSLSLDNAVVNATVLNIWNHKWRQLFLVVGLPIAVFGMRLVFPILIVSLTTGMGMVETILLAVQDPNAYAAHLTATHHEVAAFGGTFLFMVAFEYFFDGGHDPRQLQLITSFFSLGEISRPFSQMFVHRGRTSVQKEPFTSQKELLMPEDKQNSGVKPEQKPQPTIIRSVPPTPPVPTTIKPTVIGGTTPSAPSPTMIKPTVIVQKESVPAPVTSTFKPTAMTSAAPVPSPVTNTIKQPSIMPGKIVRGMEVDRADLQRRFPASTPDILAKVQDRLKQTFLDTLTDVVCAQWGNTIQKRYAELTEKSLSVTSLTVLQDCQRHLVRLTELLGKLAEYFEGKHSTGIGPWKKTESPWNFFQAAQPEFNQLSQLLTANVPALVTQQEKLSSLELEFKTLAFELEVESIVGDYLAIVCLPKDRVTAIQALEMRSGSLVSTIALIKQGAAMRQIAQQNNAAILMRIQEGVQNALPAWRESVVFTYQRPAQSETDLYTLRQGLAGVRQRLT